MARFFTTAPIFAWVLALFISVLGLVAIQQLPIAQYPPVAPPSVVISAAYPGVLRPRRAEGQRAGGD